MELGILSEEDLLKHIRVVAEDFKIKFQIRDQLKLRESQVAELANRQRSDRGCALCPNRFTFFRKPFHCRNCSRLVCASCHRGDVCLYCIEEREVSYKRKQWEILCPFEEGKFGRVKYECKDFKDKSEQEWILRAMIELHILRYLNEQFDTADARIIIISNTLATAKRKLVSALDNFDGLCPYTNIDEALGQVTIYADATAVERYPIQSENCTYLHLLTNAVIVQIVAKKQASPSASSNTLVVKPYCQLQKPMHARGSMTTFRRKKPVNRTPVPQARRNPPNSRNSVPSNSSRGDCIGTRSSAVELAVQMSAKCIEARSGELVKITCVVHTDSEDVDVKWYHGDEELPNGGRFRALRAGYRHCLEIFDCSSADHGEILCTAINNTSIASDTVILNVREDDIAGEEPTFSMPLTAEEVNGNLVLKCGVVGYPLPYITFHRRSRRIQTDRQCTIEREDDKWTLKLKNCNVDDEGRYTAVARNRVGRTLSCCRVLLSHKTPASYIADV